MTANAAIARHEAHLPARVGARHAIAFAYGRHALIAILRALQLEPGDGVVLSPLTCNVVPLALLSLGLRPQWADVSPATLHLDPEAAAAAVDEHTKALLFQHTYGDPAGRDGAANLAERHRMPWIEDRAQCMPCSGATAGGPAGTAAIYSNNLSKPLPAGSGGMAVTDDAGLAGRVRELRDRLPPRPWTAELGHRVESWLHAHVLRPRLYWPLFDLKRRFGSGYHAHSREREISEQIAAIAHRPGRRQARIGERWLRQAEAIADHRRLCCRDYARQLAGAPGLVLPAADAAEPLYYFPVLTERKVRILERACRERVEIVAWPLRTVIYPVTHEDRLPIYGYHPGSCPRAEHTAARLLGLPTHPGIDGRERQRVVDLLTRETR